MARHAIVLSREAPGDQEGRLCRVLELFGVSFRVSSLDQLADEDLASRQSYAVLGGAGVIAAAHARPDASAVLANAAAVFAFAEADEAATRAMSALSGLEWQRASAARGAMPVNITSAVGEVTGPMSGLRFAAERMASDGFFVPIPTERAAGPVAALVSVDGAPAFVRTELEGVPCYLSASTAVVDIDQPVSRNFYDVKEQLLAAVPIVMFLRTVFRDVMWQTPELGACLIIDDPLLKNRYGFCDFHRLREQMQTHAFTTNIAFIPWNWRRTSQRDSAFFRGSSQFSVSVHGCDHIAAEFGATSPEVIEERARLAQARMRKHRARTGIAHDPIMVFPQGVFSADCPAVLKRNGFVAAVNTEVSPTGENGPRTLVGDVWDTAILRYGGFAIYTRRYQHHGLENFAFDLLLGKPCFIVAHHEAFRDGGVALVRLVDELSSLNCRLTWRSPREVVRRAYRLRRDGGGRMAVRMYATEALLTNDGDQPREFAIDKPEPDASLIARVVRGGRDTSWTDTRDGLHLRCVLGPRETSLVEVYYRERVLEQRSSTSMRYQLTVAARRILSEVRDEYVQRLPLPVQ